MARNNDAGAEMVAAPKVAHEVGGHGEEYGIGRLRSFAADDNYSPGQVVGGLDGWVYSSFLPGEMNLAQAETWRQKLAARGLRPITGPRVQTPSGEYIDTPAGREAQRHRGVRVHEMPTAELWASDPDVAAAHFKRRRERAESDPLWRDMTRHQRVDLGDAFRR